MASKIMRVGIITMPAGYLAGDNPMESFITEANVKWFEDASVQVIPIPFTLPIEDAKHYFDGLNGLYLQGGPTYDPTYFRLVQEFLQLAIDANNRGDYFPVWGTCHGFQMFIMFIGRIFPLEKINALCDFKGTLTLFGNDTATKETSRLLNALSPDFIQDMQMPNSIFFSHEHGITVDRFQGNKALVDNLKILTTTKDRSGKEYVSTIEGTVYPFYGVQYHPEVMEPRFDQMRDFFIGEMRKNGHSGSTLTSISEKDLKPCRPSQGKYHIVFGSKRCYIFD